MHFTRGRMYKVLVVLVVLWAALAVMVGALNKADAELGSAAGSTGAAMELALKLCAVIFTAVAAAASGVLHKLRRSLSGHGSGAGRRAPAGFKRRYRPPPHGFSLLKALQIIVV